jgi:hypothetical protein
MANNALAVVQSQLQAIDVTKIAEYSRKLKDIGSITKMMAPMYLRDFILAYDATNTLYASAIRCDIMAATAFDTAKSIAYLDNARAYLEARNIKDTAEARKQYVDVDADVIAAADTKAKTAALVQLLRNKLQEFRMAHDDVKKMTYGDGYSSPEEGY